MTAAPKHRLYLVATSHLDTQWRWTIRTTIRHFLRRTLQDNFALFEEFPEYVLSFEGSFRYRLIQEYYPAEYQKLQALVRQNRWRLAGSMLDAPDTNLPSAESLIRHILYGNDDFERQFGRRSLDIFLPDCFGFPWSLPTIAAHCGIEGFSSQKLIKWISPATIPFDLGLWEGPDGSRVVAVLDPGGYGEPLREDLSKSETWRERLQAKQHDTGLAIGYKYFGVGDRGGAPDATSLDWLRKSLSGDGDIDVIHTGSDQLFRDLTPEDRSRLPVHRGDLLLPTHGTGCWTSQAVLKQWNRRCEVLSGAAETAALAAGWLGAIDVPYDEIGEEWRRFLWHQMHDDLTGTSSPEAYRFSWNDLVLTQNRLTDIVRSSVAAVARSLDTRGPGIPLVVYNPTGFDHEDLVDAWVDFDAEAPAAIRVLDPSGAEVPSQVIQRTSKRVRVLFPAKLGATGFAVFQVQAAAEEASNQGAAETGLAASNNRIENSRYRVDISESGAAASLFDKRLERELLAAPMDLVLLPDHSSRWPAWEIRYEDVCAEETPLAGPATIRVVESGPVRVTIEITRSQDESTFKQRLSLACGEAGDRLEISCNVDWQSRGRLLKASFPTSTADAVATYDMGVGAIERAPNCRQQYEVPGHEWADLSETDWGVAVLSRDKYGWDRPATNTLRLSLLRSPKALRRFAHQAVQDLGQHRFSYAICGHSGGPGPKTVSQASAFNQPLLSFQARPHAGELGKELSLLQLKGDGFSMMALKRAERTGEWLTRIREIRGRDSGPITITTAAPLRKASQVGGCESDPIPLPVVDGKVSIGLPRYALTSLLLSPEVPAVRPTPTETTHLALDFDVPATSFHGLTAADLDGRGHSIPGELFPQCVRAGGHNFPLGPALPGASNAMSCRGQSLSLGGGGDFDRLHFLATSTGRRGTTAPFGWEGASAEAGQTANLRVPYYSGFIGQWKRFGGRLAFIFGRSKPGYLEKTPIAWVGTHRHDRRIHDQVYTYCYLFLFELPIPTGATALVLPHAPAIKLFSALASNGGRYVLRAASELYG